MDRRISWVGVNGTKIKRGIHMRKDMMICDALCMDTWFSGSGFLFFFFLQ
jgi:hypothetical protein